MEKSRLAGPKETKNAVSFLWIILAFVKRERKARTDCHQKNGLREENGRAQGLGTARQKNFKETGGGSKRGQERED